MSTGHVPSLLPSLLQLVVLTTLLVTHLPISICGHDIDGTVEGVQECAQILQMTSRAILVPIADRMQSPIQIHERADCGTNRSQSSQYQQILYEVFYDTSTFFFRYFYFQNIRRNLPPVFNSGNKKRGRH